MADSVFTEEVLRAITEGARRIRGLPDPEQNVEALYITVMALKEAVETLLRSRGLAGDSALLVKEIEPLLGVVDQLITNRLGDFEGGGTPTNPDFDGTHGSLDGVLPDQHHNQQHDLFSSDHPDIDLTTRATGSALIWQGDVYRHVVVPTIETTQAVIDPGETSPVFGFTVSETAKAAKLLLRVTDATNDLTRASEVRVVTNDSEVFTTHYGMVGDVVLYKVEGTLLGGECGIQVTNNHTDTISVETLPVITAN